jgi:hypothetical protein
VDHHCHLAGAPAPTGTCHLQLPLGMLGRRLACRAHDLGAHLDPPQIARLKRGHRAKIAALSDQIGALLCKIAPRESNTPSTEASLRPRRWAPLVPPPNALPAGLPYLDPAHIKIARASEIRGYRSEGQLWS